jgi:hypothetical protein
MPLLAVLFVSLLGACAGSPAPELRVSDCPEHWIDASFLGMGCLHMASTRAYNWDDANNYCQQQPDAMLVEIKSEQEFEFLKSQLEILEDHEGPHTWWTAGTDVGRNGDWVWATSYMPVPTWIWGNLMPDGNRGDNCMVLNSAMDYMARNVLCSQEDSFYPICQSGVRP